MNKYQIFLKLVKKKAPEKTKKQVWEMLWNKYSQMRKSKKINANIWTSYGKRAPAQFVPLPKLPLTLYTFNKQTKCLARNAHSWKKYKTLSWFFKVDFLLSPVLVFFFRILYFIFPNMNFLYSVFDFSPFNIWYSIFQFSFQFWFGFPSCKKWCLPIWRNINGQNFIDTKKPGQKWLANLTKQAKL